MIPSPHSVIVRPALGCISRSAARPWLVRRVKVELSPTILHALGSDGAREDRFYIDKPKVTTPAYARFCNDGSGRYRRASAAAYMTIRS